ncbi:MAG: hypothetical protein L6282_13665 [Candidatus Methanoperedenaceae archaeon]|nr:hypothetical protein [Candidatus Methanoperedenaceae archaeon]
MEYHSKYRVDGSSITDADIVMVCIRLYLFKSRRRAVAAVCPAAGAPGYPEGLRLFECAGWAV